MRYVPSRQVSRILSVHPQTLRAWAREGRIDYIRTECNQRRYDVDSYIGTSKPTIVVCYCRVSSKKQAKDLERQVAFMRARYPDAEVVSDVASGLNVVAYRDRQPRGFHLRTIHWPISNRSNAMNVGEGLADSIQFGNSSMNRLTV